LKKKIILFDNYFVLSLKNDDVTSQLSVIFFVFFLKITCDKVQAIGSGSALTSPTFFQDVAFVAPEGTNGS